MLTMFTRNKENDVISIEKTLLMWKCSWSSTLGDHWKYEYAFPIVPGPAGQKIFVWQKIRYCVLSTVKFVLSPKGNSIDYDLKRFNAKFEVQNVSWHKTLLWGVESTVVELECPTEGSSAKKRFTDTCTVDCILCFTEYFRSYRSTGYWYTGAVQYSPFVLSFAHYVLYSTGLYLS